MAVLCAISFLFAWQNVQATKLGYSIEKLRREIKDMENANTYLKKEIQTFRSPKNLESEALRLGMVYPEPGSAVQLDGEPVRKELARGWLARFLRFNKAS